LALSGLERERLDVLRRLMRGELRQARAAELLGIGVRQRACGDERHALGLEHVVAGELHHQVSGEAVGATAGKCEGRKSLAELRPEVVELARELRCRRPKPTLRAIAAELAARGHVAASGKPFEASVVARMVEARKRRVERL
jgi:hypothetical protein